MTKDLKRIKGNTSSNASASVFGWDFQSNAAIFLMIENIKTAKAVKVEGNTEDIEITLNNGKTIYSQAKSLEDINSTSHIIDKLKDALRTLNNAYLKGNSECLIYITNHSNPFNNVRTSYLFEGLTSLEYDELPDSCKEKIKKIINDNGYSLDLKQLIINVLPFFGRDRGNREKFLKERITKFLNDLQITNPYTPQRMLEIWQKDFFHNATIPDDTIKIRKEDIVWSLIVDLCAFDKCDTALDGCDDAMIEEIERNYKNLINNKSEDFEFFNNIISDYNNFGVNLTRKEKTEKFINEEYINYKNHFDSLKIDEEIKNCLIKIILKKIIHIRYVTDTIKKGTCL